MADNDSEHLGQLLDSYPAAITDFFGSGGFCIYKTGPAWPVAPPNAQKLIRAARPYNNPEKAPIWTQVLKSIAAFLDSLEVEVQLTAIDPLAYANVGEAKLFCNFVVVISVNPHTLAYQDAVAAAPGVLAILENAGFYDAQVAFVEALYRRRQVKFMGFNPNFELEGIANLRKPFTPSLGVSIALHDKPHYEGTGSVFVRLSSDPSDKRIFLLTCAHVAHPPPEFENRVYSRKNPSQPRENVILLGDKTYKESVDDIMKMIGEETMSISTWEASLGRLPAQADDEPAGLTGRRQELTNLIAIAKMKITAADELHTAVTKYYTFPDCRNLGFVFYCAEIGVGKDGYMYDWALIELDVDKLEAGSFLGNKLYVGGNKTELDWENYMFPQLHDHHDFHVPEDLLLQLKDYVRESEFRDPQNHDIYDQKTLLAVKNGRTSGTTYGRVNGLESLTREYHNDGLKVDAFEIIVLGYDTKRGKNMRFSEAGDSGAMVVDRLGRLIGQLTGGGGPTDATDKSYITPYFKLKLQIEAVFKEFHLLPPRHGV
ncbi:hypothetical protein CYLTODRAFT_175680 [Cylindrobasidium torrendii FP15055 ss-10]|uniref:Uncharacterized protein n=1 Tax=Cylindrobasidium torrendii FP15055 ss-10 TaxID=1314674 RepID=A0A0D7AVS1_9AGAR|nr:hypothetical protein CYLTODRAFT_175680 [Cylindrobasidium torrendii FP15055 ss-10]